MVNGIEFSASRPKDVALALVRAEVRFDFVPSPVGGLFTVKPIHRGIVDRIIQAGTFRWLDDA